MAVDGIGARSEPNWKGKRGWVGWPFTQGGGLGGLALGYYQAAPPGLRKGEHLSSPRGQQGIASFCQILWLSARVIEQLAMDAEGCHALTIEK
jgi:hypothetical protein